jgi:hypothetical protein
MSNSILRVDVGDRSLAPAQAEVWITVVPERMDAGTEVRGRLLGPRSACASTVEVAYQLRPLAPGIQGDPAGITRRVVIPEANLWEPAKPFLYQGPVELWQDGACCGRVVVSHGLRSIALGPRGLRLNGKPLVLSGHEVARAPEEGEARELRDRGCNLLLAPVAADGVWEVADRLGYLVLGRLAGGGEETLRQAATLAGHASCLGWLVPPGADFITRLPPGGLVGAEVSGQPCAPVPEGVHFLLGPATEAGALAGIGLPLLLAGEPGAPAGGSSAFRRPGSEDWLKLGLQPGGPPILGAISGA